jgi:RNA polymerase sigma-70 factor (ECF subfamily)
MILAEQRLVERLRAGDRDALGILYETYADRVLAFAFRRLGDRHEAQDVCQDVFVAVVRSIDGYEGRSSLSTWILGIAWHEIADRYRRRRREPVATQSVGHEPPAAGGRLDGQVDAARALARCEEVLQREVSSSQRAVFDLHAQGAGDVASIARTVGKSRQAVKISLLRTRRRLLSRVVGLRDLLPA